MDLRNISIIVFAIVVALVLLAVIFIPTPLKPEKPQKESCIDGLARNCSTGPCNGTQTCANGSWTMCTWEVVCKSGSRSSCDGNICSCEYRLCNACGSGYGPCIKNCSVG